MARLPRIVVPGQPLHIIQRGNNREPCFFADEDYRFYRDSLQDASSRYGCRVHAYVLMTNHVHLLLTPETIASPSAVLQSIGRRYVRYVNQVYRRTGTLWEGRFKSALIDSERYLLTCSRYIELNPVRARMVEEPGDYRWSSYRHNALGQPDVLLTPHFLYESLDTDGTRRCATYRSLFSVQTDPVEIQAIRTATETGTLLGNDRFKKNIETTLKRRMNDCRTAVIARANSFETTTSAFPINGRVQKYSFVVPAKGGSQVYQQPGIPAFASMTSF